MGDREAQVARREKADIVLHFFLWNPRILNPIVLKGIGIKVLTGDHFHLFCMAFSKQNTLMDMQGKTHRITPAPDVYGPFIPSSLIYNYYDYYDSSYKIKAVLGDYSPKFLVPGHEPSLLVTGVE